MRVICDVETDGLDPKYLWVIVCKDIDTGEVRVFERPDLYPKAFQEYSKHVSLWVGHNFLGYDYWVINRLVPLVRIHPSSCIDTLVVSRLLDANQEGGHSLERWGEHFNFPKIKFHDWTHLSPEMVTYCKQDVELNFKIFKQQEPYIYSSLWKDSLRVEHEMVLICNDLKKNGFSFDITNARQLYETVVDKLKVLTIELEDAFFKRSKLLKEVTPKLTKAGTLSRTDFRWVLDGDLTPYQADAPFSRLEWVTFNPGSPKQVIERLNEAGWKPYEKTKGHQAAEKAFQRAQSKKERAEWALKLEHFQVYGWKVSEANLETLPSPLSFPEGSKQRQILESSRKLVEWIILDSRRSTLEEWFKAFDEASQAIHGTFYGIGSWTHRMSHAGPNMANIPTFHGLPKDREPTAVELIKAETDPLMRQFWRATPGRLLIGVDADSIQLRVLAHYMNDERFIQALVSGDKANGTDAHTLNKNALGSVCESRDDAKTFIYAWLLGAGLVKVSQILKCTLEEAKQANDSFLDYYPGLRYLKDVIIPQDANSGYFRGFDGRFVKCASEHLMLAGYLQNGESCIMKKANIIWRNQLEKEKIPFWQVNFVHDEWQTETINDMDTAKYIAQIQAESIKTAGEIYELNCPMLGTFFDGKKYSIGTNWKETH